MFTTIVWPTDVSANPASALRYAKALATGEGAMLIAVHIVQDPADGNADRNSAAETGHQDAATVRKLVGELSQEGVDAILKVVDFVGPQPAQGIADIARDVGADVIAVGTRGHSTIGGLLAGSVTQRLLHIAPCPVLSAPPVTLPQPQCSQVKPAEPVICRRFPRREAARIGMSVTQTRTNRTTSTRPRVRHARLNPDADRMLRPSLVLAIRSRSGATRCRGLTVGARGRAEHLWLVAERAVDLGRRLLVHERGR